jgi:putative transposase
MPVMNALAALVGVKTACAALGVPRSSRYAARHPRPKQDRPPAPPPPRTLTVCEKASVRETLNSDRFVDQAPREVYATLLDEGTYLCSIPSMYRILRENAEVVERRNQLRHPTYVKPQLLATGPNEVWTWDITKLLGPLVGVYFYLYVLLDLFSRFVVGWLIAEREAAALAEQLIADSCLRQQIGRDQLTLHSDRGAPMTAKSLTVLLADLGVLPSLARPRIPDDNAFSEAQFKTVKYHPTFPGRFGGVLDARTWAQKLFYWYNYAHHHTALGLMTPAAVHTGLAPQLHQQRQGVLAAAYAAHPERFVRGLPQPPALPSAVWLNPPAPEEKARCDTAQRH